MLSTIWESTSETKIVGCINKELAASKHQHRTRGLTNKTEKEAVEFQHVLGNGWFMLILVLPSWWCCESNIVQFLVTSHPPYPSLVRSPQPFVGTSPDAFRGGGAGDLTKDVAGWDIPEPNGCFFMGKIWEKSWEDHLWMEDLYGKTHLFSWGFSSAMFHCRRL